MKCAVALAALGAAVACNADKSKHIHALEQILPIVDRELQQCIFGVVEPDDQLGRMEAIAEITGALDYGRVHSCYELMRQKLDAIPHDDPELESFWLPVPIKDTAILHDFSICYHIADARERARKLGATTPAPDCASHIERLTNVVDPGNADVHRYRDKLALVSEGLEKTVRRTRDAVTWDTSAPLQTPRVFVTGASEVFAYSFPNEHENARYTPLVGTAWHVGAHAIGDDVVGLRHTVAGWTIVSSDFKTDTPIVVNTDASMDHVTSQMLPTLRGKWSGAVKRVALIDTQGHAAAVVVSGNGDHVKVEAPPTVVTIASKVTEPRIHSCRGPTADYIVIEDVAMLASFDSGRSFHVYANTALPEPLAIDCTDTHLFVATLHTFTSCDRESCRRTPMPVPKETEAHVDINVRDETPLVFTAYDDVATLTELRDNDLKTISAWKIADNGRPPLVRIGELWFAP